MKNFKNVWKYFSQSEGSAAILLSGVVLFVSVLVGILHTIRQKRKERKERSLEEQKLLVFTLPDRENQFVRERLNGTLCALKDADIKREIDLTNQGVNFASMRNLLIKIRHAPLSVSEKLQAEAISVRTTEFALKNKLTQEEFAELNEKLSLTLKLAAKYKV